MDERKQKKHEKTENFRNDKIYERKWAKRMKLYKHTQC